jgi:hypothetical protein
MSGDAGGEKAIENAWDVPTKNLEKSLRAYLDNGHVKPFDLVRLSALTYRNDGVLLNSLQFWWKRTT